MSSASAVIAAWSELWDSTGPEDRAWRLLSAADALGTHDLGAVRRAYRRAIEQALPQGFYLRNNTFYGPAGGLRLVAGALVDDAGRTTLQLHHDVLEQAVHGPVGTGADAYFWQIADRHRLSADGLRLYGDWTVFTGETSPEASVRTALALWGRTHVQELADSGRHPIEVLSAALLGQFGTEDDVAQVAARYRTALAAVLPPGFALDGDAVYGPHPPVEADVKGAVLSVDLVAVVAAYATAPRELLTAQQVADVIGAASADSARHTLSRWGVTAAEYRTEAGRVQARWDGDQVRTAWRSRPGRGRRTQLLADGSTGGKPGR
ncbi:hypothetical protein ACEZDB_36120 [Streptacidiphilus sp. N1-3]|uniref:Uncharacterized protein n=1 Tax=Streptacidiphilus alkalitolerans TaxID=3342712 RepID=A0ABV6XCT1_9ACTN